MYCITTVQKICTLQSKLEMESAIKDELQTLTEYIFNF